MKNHRFPWLRNRTTDNRKCEKARNIKEKRTIEMFNTVSKQLVALRSSASVNLFVRFYTTVYAQDIFPGRFLLVRKDTKRQRSCHLVSPERTTRKSESTECV